MEDLYVAEIAEAINYIALNPGCTIDKISSDTHIPLDIVRQILMYNVNYPFGRIGISCYGYPSNLDISDLDYDILDGNVRWEVDMSEMDKIPVENFEKYEQFTLVSLLHRLDDKMIPFDGIKTQVKSLIYTKGGNTNTYELFLNRHYKVIRKALLESLYLLIKYEGAGDKLLQVKPLGLVYSAEEELWYIISSQENNNIRTLRLDKIRSADTGETCRIPADFDLKEYLRNSFSLEDENEEYFDIIFLDEANVINKAKKRLHNKGNMEVDEDGTMRFRGDIKGSSSMTSWLLGFGSSAIVLKPKNVREEIIENHKKVVQNYSKSRKWIK